jgi:hypothetical protein
VVKAEIHSALSIFLSAAIGSLGAVFSAQAIWPLFVSLRFCLSQFAALSFTVSFCGAALPWYKQIKM